MWAQGDSYEAYIGRWSRAVAPLFLDWLAIPAGRRWLDLGCGTGALSTAILDRCAPASVVGVEPSDGFRATAAERLGARVELLAGNAGAIPLTAGAVDVAVSGLVLNFVPDEGAALDELTRVTRPGGTVAAYVWDYADRMELVRRFWDAAAELDPGAVPLHEGARFPGCRPDSLAERFRGGGLLDVDGTAIEVPTVFPTFDDYWRPFLGGQGPAPAYVAALDEAGRTRLRDRLHATLPIGEDGSVALVARAWAVRGTVPG
jgi:SAM-dependent methyltransferase